MRLAYAALAVALCAAAPAFAQDAAGHEPPPEALALYQHGRELYRAGQYHEAAQELERALMLDPTSPNLVYNVARVHELLGELPVAISYYERYLTVLPPDDAEERDRTQSTIARLRGAQHEVHQPPPGPAGELRDVGPEVHIEHGVVDEAFIGTAVVSGLAIGVAIVMGVLALVRDNDVANFVSDGTDPSLKAMRDGLISDEHTFALTADVLGIVGGIGALAVVFLYFLRDHIVETPRDQATDRASSWLRPSMAIDAHRAVFVLEGSL